jgi:hypothetical protein
MLALAGKRLGRVAGMFCGPCDRKRGEQRSVQKVCTMMSAPGLKSSPTPIVIKADEGTG